MKVRNINLGVVSINRKLFLGVLLLFGIALTLNFNHISAADSSSITIQNLQTKQTSSVAKLAATTTIKKTTNYTPSYPVSTKSIKTVRVLIYNGNDTINNCVNGIIKSLNSANNKSLVPGYRFTYAKSTTINSTILANYDLIVMPGGNSGYKYIQSTNINSSAIRSFVSSGHGFLGICAGAYAGSKYVGGSEVSYSGWGIAPNVNSKLYNHEGNLSILLTSNSTQLLTFSGTVTLAHYNGPAMYGTGFITFAKYTISNYNGYAAIVGDTYGSGRTVLSGPHPELSPSSYNLLNRLIVWAANVQTSANTITISHINKIAKDVKTYIENNHKLPVCVTVDSTLFTRAQFLYLLTTSLQRINSGSTSTLTVKSIESPSATTDTVKSGKILKADYLTLASRINKYIANNGRVPGYITSKLENINFENMIYMYSKIMAFYYSNGRLPSYVSMTNGHMVFKKDCEN